LTFDKLKGLTLFKGRVKALHGTVVLTADEIRAFTENNAATAKGHVRVVDKTQAVTLTCGNLEYQDLMETMTAHDHPILTSVDNVGKPVSILGRQMELDSQKKIIVVNQNVKIEQTNSTSEAQKATFLADDNKLILEDDPTVYTSNAEISARRITMNLGTGKSFFAEGLADAVFNPSGAPLPTKSKPGASTTATPGAKGAVAAGTAPAAGSAPVAGGSTISVTAVPTVGATPVGGSSSSVVAAPTVVSNPSTGYSGGPTPTPMPSTYRGALGR
jgi:lipopolysaccharide export system protein LptA